MRSTMEVFPSLLTQKEKKFIFNWSTYLSHYFKTVQHKINEPVNKTHEGKDDVKPTFVFLPAGTVPRTL